MEKVEFHTPEEKMICNMIFSARRYMNKNVLGKNIYISFDELEGNLLRSVLHINFNKKTGSVGVSPFGIAYKNIIIYPSKNKKLRCTNQHAREVFKKRRQIIKQWQNENNKDYLYIRYHTNPTHARKLAKKYYHRKVEAGINPKENQQVIVFSNSIESNISIRDTLGYNKKTGHVYWMSRFEGFHGIKLKYIDEK